jgi:hypothetical protein
MFTVNTVQDELITLIGWREDKNPEATQNPMGDLLTASSGLYFNDAHKLLTPENLSAVFADFAKYTYPTFSLSDTYAKGKIVKTGSPVKYYISLANGNINNPVASSPTYWRETTPFNEQLREITTSGITLGLNQWINRKVDLRTAANLLKRKQVLTPPGYKVEEVGDTKRYLGWRIVPSPKHPDVVLTIDKVSIHMRASQTVTLRLYKNGAQTAIQTLTFTGTGTADTIWMDAGWTLEPGSFYYLAYDRNDLTNADAVPYNDIHHMDKYHFTFNRFPDVLPFAEVSAFEHDGPAQSGWSDVTDIQVNNTNFGINVSLSASCDYTNLIKDQKELFKMVIYYAVAIEALKFMIYNPNARTTRQKLNINDQQLLFEIGGNPDAKRKTGLESELWRAINAVTVDSRALCKYCLPCRKSSIKYTST